MLKFIVLGQVPGTEIQINFYPFLIIVCVIGIVTLAWLYLYDRRRRTVQVLANLLAVI